MAKIKQHKTDTIHDEFDGSTLEARTELGSEFIRQFRKAMWTKNSTAIGEYKLTDLLRKCKRAREDAPSREEIDMREKYPEWASMPVSIVSFKVGILVAIMRETLVDIASAPFIIDPTPNPEIPEDKYNDIISKLTEQIEQVGEQTAELQRQAVDQAVSQGLDPSGITEDMLPHIDPDALIEMVKEAKLKALYEVRQHAREQALLMQREIYDRTVEGDYRKAILEFADDFALYPFGCIHGPYPTVRTNTKWENNKFKEVDEIVWTFERVSPFDLFWTDDSVDTQNGTAVFVRKYVPYSFLYDARRLAKQGDGSGYIEEALTELIELTKEATIPKNWTDFHAGNPELQFKPLIWSQGDTIEIVIRYGRFRGYDLKEMGFTNLDDDKSYETKVVMCGGEVIQAQLNNNPSRFKRPVFTASFERRNGSIAGIGLGQKLLGIHNAYRACINLAMYNLGLSSEPITEIELGRILQYMPEDWVDDPSIYPGMTIPADGDRMGNGSRAIKFTQIPNITSQALQMANFIFEQAHTISNIPAALHGQPVGSGANRTVRGLLTLQGNTLKPIQSSLMNLDMDIIEPMVTLMYMLLVMYDDDFDYSGDCKVIAKGAASMVQREIEKQTALENLQILGQMGPNVNPELLNRAMESLLQLSGILEPGEKAIATPQPALDAIPPQVPAQAPTAESQSLSGVNGQSLN